MNPASSGQRLRPAARIFGAVAAGFLLVLAGLMGWVAMDHYGARQTAVSVTSRSLPQSLERLRLVRNLEALRFEGLRAVSGPTEEVRRHARFVIDLIAGNPDVRQDPESAMLAGQVADFVRASVARSAGDPEVEREWDRLSRAVAIIADRVTADGMAGITADAERLEAQIRHGTYKLVAAVVIAVMAMVGFLLMIERIFVHPLGRIDRALAELDRHPDPPSLPLTRTREIASISDATLALHAAIRENERIRAGLEALATTDALTGLSNRRHFMVEAGTATALAHRHRRPITIAMADIDHFKQVNDEHGHAVGDAVLAQVGQVFRASLRATDLCCRYGGEEFAFLFPETSPDEARGLLDRLRLAVEQLRFPSDTGRGPRVSLSIGMADASTHGLEGALGLADDALYRAKRGGRNRIEA